MDHEGDGDNNCNWTARNNLHRIGKWIERLGTKGDLPDCRIMKIGQNTGKSPGEFEDLLSLKLQ